VELAPPAPIGAVGEPIAAQPEEQHEEQREERREERREEQRLAVRAEFGEAAADASRAGLSADASRTEAEGEPPVRAEGEPPAPAGGALDQDEWASLIRRMLALYRQVEAR
jgi:hypothetical protein